MKIVVSCSDKYIQALKVFSYFFNKYFIDEEGKVFLADIAGYNPPTNFELPDNFIFHSISKTCYPKEKWVDGFLEYLDSIGDDHLILFLEDYWLCRYVDISAIRYLLELMKYDSSILRADLTSDRQFAGGVKDIGYYKRLDLIDAKGSQYEMSLQCGIWNRKLLIDVLGKLPKDAHSAWDVELVGTNVVNDDQNIRIIGTKQAPIKYVNGFNNAATGVNFYPFSKEDSDIAKQLLGIS